MEKITAIWNNLLYKGVNPHNPFEIQYGICKGVNLLCLVIISINIVCGPGYALASGEAMILIGSFIEILFLMLVIYLNSRRKYISANFTFFAIINIATLFFGILLGERANVVLMIVFLAGLVMFAFEKWKIIIPCITFSVSILVAIEYSFKHQLFKSVKSSPITEDLMRYTALLVVTGLVITVFYLFAELKRKALNNERENSLSKTMSIEKLGNEVFLTKKELENESEKTKYQSTYLHILGHDFKQVMALVPMMAEDLSKYVHDDLGKEALNTLQLTCNNVRMFTENILEQSKIDSKIKRSTRFENVQLHDFISELVSMMNRYAIERDRRVKLEISYDVPKSIFSDQSKIQVIVNNLLNNAIKFSLCNSDIILRLLSNESYWIIEVENIGEVIPKDQIKKIFEPFVKKVGARNERNGTGLGLSITKNLVDLLAGKITVQSTENEKTVFTVTIPFSAKRIKVRGSWRSTLLSRHFNSKRLINRGDIIRRTPRRRKFNI